MSNTRTKSPASRESNLDPATVGMVLFLFTEIMFFAGLFTALAVLRLQGSSGWPPADHPRLPLLITGINTGVLLLSGILLSESFFHTSKRFLLSVLSLISGAVFLVIQGYEWVQLMAHGLSVSTSTYGGFFYALVGSHALHALAGLGVLAWITYNLYTRNDYSYFVPSLYWFFVVLMWPIIYFTVYF